MASSSKIDELKKKFDENPRRYFAPLASEYRKMGDLEQAIAICREHLPRQPGHMSGHIVYGQALFDARELEEAKTVFETALTLDPENLIALRHLGDIALQAGDAEAARGWYHRVLEADPRNEEMAALLTAASSGGPPGPPPEGAPHDADAESATRWAPPPVEKEASPEAVEAAAEAPPPQTEELPRPAWPTAPDDSPTLIMEAYSPPSPPEALGAEAAPETAPLELEADLSFDMPPMRPVASSAGTGRSAFGVELDRVDDAVLSAPATATPEAATTPTAFPEFSMPAAEAEPLPVPPPAADPFATDTMAELYLAQGHYADALRVYRELESQRPEDSSLDSKIARVQALMAPTPVVAMPAVPEFSQPAQDALDAATEEMAVPEQATAQSVPSVAAEAPVSGPTIRQFLGSLAMRTPYAGNIIQASPEPPQAEAVVAELDVELEDATSYPEDDVAAPGDESSADEPLPSVETSAAYPESSSTRPAGSIDALFGGGPVPGADSNAASMLANAFGAEQEVVASEPAPMSGAPARRASNELSLDNVFRDDAAQSPAPAASFSFDQFFAAPTPAAGTPAVHPTPGPAGPATEDDIEQFNSWLQGLKKR